MMKYWEKKRKKRKMDN